MACSDDAADDGAEGSATASSPEEEQEEASPSPAEEFCEEAEELVDELNPIVGDVEHEDEALELRLEAEEMIEEAGELDVSGDDEEDVAECVADLQGVISAGEVSGRRPSAFPAGEFATGRPADHGLDPADVEALDRLAEQRGSNCIAVVHDGVLVHDSYWNGTDARTQQEIFSATKSITAFLVGIAQDQGVLDIDDPVADHIPAWRGTPSAEVTIRNLLSNDSGRQYDFTTDYAEMAIRVPDKSAFAVDLTQEDPPGTVWAYNNSAIQVLEEVLEVTTGRDVAAFAEEHLFGPIGMASTINHDASGNTLAFMGGQASCQDLARFGLLALNEGTWDGEQVVSAEFVREATQPSQDLNTTYGFLWWLNSDGPRVAGLDGAEDPVVDDGSLSWPDAPPDAYAAQGLGGQLVIVVPSERLVISRLGPAGADMSTNETAGTLLGA